MSNKIVSSGASGKRGFSGSSGGGSGQAALTEHYIGFGDSSNLLTGSGNLQWNDSTRIMSLTGDEDIEAIIQSGRKLTIQSTGQDMNVSGLIVNVTSGSGNVEITSADNLNLTASSGDCAIKCSNGEISLTSSNQIDITAQNGEINFRSGVSERFTFHPSDDPEANNIEILLNSSGNNTIFTSENGSLIIQNATKKLGFFDNDGATQKTVSLNSDLTLTGLQSSLNALITALGNTSESGYGLIAN